MPFYPRLPEPVAIDNPITAGMRGLGAGMEIQNQALKAQTTQLALEEARNRQQALKEYGETRYTESLRKNAPDLAVQMEKSLMGLDKEKRGAALNKLTGLITEADKALPWFVAAAKTNPEEAAKWWPKFIGEAQKAGFNVPPGMENFSPETVQAAWKLKEDMKSAAARMRGEYGMQIAKTKGEYGLAGRRLSGEYNLAGRGISADARIRAAEIGANRPGRGIDPAKTQQQMADKLNAIDQKERAEIAKYRKSDEFLMNTIPQSVKDARITEIKKGYETDRQRNKAAYGGGGGKAQGAAWGNFQALYNANPARAKELSLQRKDGFYERIMQQTAPAPPNVTEEDED